MSYGVRLRVWGERACFSRPEMKVERVSYDVMTPSAARGILEAIHWKPAIRWVVDRIHVLSPIRFETLRRNEVGHKVPAGNARTAMKAGSTQGLHAFVDDDRQQRAATVLRDVDYVIEAHFAFTERAGDDENAGKHRDTFRRRAEKGQCFHMPYLGTREFPARFRWMADDEAVPDPHREVPAEKDLGWMLHDFTFGRDAITPHFFRAVMHDGTVDVPALDSDAVKT